MCRISTFGAHLSCFGMIIKPIMQINPGLCSLQVDINHLLSKLSSQKLKFCTVHFFRHYVNLFGMSLFRINLPGMSLFRINLPGMSLFRINLPEIRLFSINLPEIRLFSINLPEIRLFSINLPEIRLLRALLP